MRVLPSILSVMLIAACSEPAEPGPQAPPDPAPAQGGLRLEPMTNDEIARAVPPLLTCVFESGDAVLLAASAPDDRDARADAVLKTGGQLVSMTRSEPGGYVGMREGASTFAGAAYEARVDRQEGEGERVGVETTRWSAELIVTRGQDEVRLSGAWSCGA